MPRMPVEAGSQLLRDSDKSRGIAIPSPALLNSEIDGRFSAQYAREARSAPRSNWGPLRQTPAGNGHHLDRHDHRAIAQPRNPPNGA